jgi:two-component system, OmpR family, phosphate regulon response regulator PhoB
MNKKKILVIDDDMAILDAITTLLEDESYEVQSNSTAFHIVEKVIEYKPDVILLDVLLSGEDGRNVAQELKTNTNTKHTPIILLSAHTGMEKHIKNAISDTFISKPFDIDYLLQQVKRLVDQ